MSEFRIVVDTVIGDIVTCRLYTGPTLQSMEYAGTIALRDGEFGALDELLRGESAALDAIDRLRNEAAFLRIVAANETRPDPRRAEGVLLWCNLIDAVTAGVPA